MLETIIFTDPYGKTRKGYQKVCLNCNEFFYTRISQDYKCCSLKCTTEYKKKTTPRSTYYVNLVCYTCKKDFERRKSNNNKSRSGLYFCSRACKEFAQSLEGGVKEIQPPHYGTGETDYRELFKDSELVCVRCGYDEFKSCVDIHHIDKNRENNDKSNLIPLCCNCHQGIHRGCWKFEDL